MNNHGDAANNYCNEALAAVDHVLFDPAAIERDVQTGCGGTHQMN
ncbi:hypothetical protein [Paraburkholderia hayleyella]|nr:hypothetical protein [Paraburkholderia hayleyella]